MYFNEKCLDCSLAHTFLVKTLLSFQHCPSYIGPTRSPNGKEWKTSRKEAGGGSHLGLAF